MCILKWIGIYLAFQAVNAFTWWFVWQFVKAIGRAFAGYPPRAPFR